MINKPTTYNNSGNKYLPSFKEWVGKVYRRIFFLFLIMLMGVGSAWAQTSDKWDGTVSASLSTQDGTSTDAGKASNPYLIQSAADLAYFGSQMNGKDWYVKLTTDIDLNNREWTYGKNSATNFKGHFDGNGKTISNFKIVPTSATNNGFFSSLQGGQSLHAEVKNLIIDGVTISHTGDLANTTTTGALAGNVTEYTDVVNVSVKKVSISFVNLTNANYVGGFVGRVQQNNCTLTGCSVVSPTISISGNISGGASFVGGAIGSVAGKAGLISTIKGLTVNDPSVKVNNITVANCYMGAVFGQLNTYFSVDGVTVSNPKLQYNSAGTNVALFLGTFAGGVKGDATQTVSVTNVNVTGIAQLTLGTESNQSTTNVQNVKGGLIGQATTNVRLEDWSIAESKVQIYGNLTGGGSHLAAFAGNITGAAAAPTIVNNISLNGNSDGTAPGSYLNVTGDVKCGCYLGGFVGQVTTNCQLGKCTIYKPTIKLNADITTASYIGGAIGDFLGTAGNTSFITGPFNVVSPSITINKNSVASTNIGAVFGRIKEYSNVRNVKVSNPSLTYTNTPNFDLYLGTFAGYITGNNVQEVVVSDITITDNANITVGTSDNSVSKLRAGVIGQATTNVRLEDWEVDNSLVTVNGSLASSASSLGGFVGYLASATNAPLTLSDVSVKNTTVKVTGGVGVKDCGLGGFIGQVVPGNALKAPIYIDNVTIDDGKGGGATSLSIDGDVTVTGNFGGFAGYVIGRAQNGTYTQISNLTIPKAILNVKGKTSASCNYGGIIGLAHQTCKFNDWTVSATELTIGETKQDGTKVDISAETYVGGAVGRITGEANNNVTATGINISGLDIAIDSELKNNLYVGGIVGRLDAYTTPNVIEKSIASGLIHSKGSHTFVQAKYYNFGGILGYTEHDASTKVSDVNNCVSEVNFDLSGFTPAEFSGSLYNLQQSGFAVGGVIGRLHKPLRLPEALYYSGKINAPFAAVAPIVGVFSLDISKNVYVYNDYCGFNASAISSDEWDAKENTWFYNGYKIGLSTAVTGQSNRTKNYQETSVENGYLTIGDVTTTFKEQNKISGEGKSYTILAYTLDNKTDVDKGIFPQWNTKDKTYPAYYMYYMQGVNRGTYVKTSEVEGKKRDILAGTLAILTLTDANGNLTISDNRGFKPHKLTASASGAEKYKWTVNGEEQAETTGSLVITPAITGSTITVESIKGEKTISRRQCKLIPVFRVSDATKDLGTKTNPYLIGSADELQLLSKLSTLPLGTQWEGNYTSADHYNKAYYEMDNDVDLSGVADFTPISFATGFVANANINQGYIFDGVFDGKQHKISGLKEEWYGGVINGNDSYLGWGLFSVLGSPIATIKVGDTAPSSAIVRNLIIDSATLTHKTTNTTFNYNETTGVGASNNVCIGVLAGITLNNTKIDNIEIRNSKITDEGSSDYSLATRGLYVGGAVGSIQNAFNEVGNAPVNTKMQHIAAQVDITLEHPTIFDTTSAEQMSKFNIGGIIGRYCATSALQDQAQASMPTYTFFSGSVTASKAWISPVLGALRYASQQSFNWSTDAKPTQATQSKQWEGNNATDATQITITNAQYYNFKINNTLITELFPVNKCGMNARSMAEHLDMQDRTDNGTYNAAKYQGVNYAARYLDSEGTSLELMNKNISDGIYWEWDDEGSKKFIHMTKVQPMNVSVIEGYRVYTANIENGSGTLTYSWQESSDLENWTNIAGASSSTWIVPLTYNEEKYIVAHVIKDGKVYRSFPFLYIPSDYILPPAIKENVSGSQHNFSIDWHDLNLTGLSITYQWYQSDKKTEISGATSSSLSLSQLELDNIGGSVWCKVILSQNSETIAEFFPSSGRIVVFVNGNNYNKNGAKPGDDNNDGMTPQTPVKTIGKANSLLDGGPLDRNIIVVMGKLNTAEFRSKGTNPATLTGKWEGIDYEGVITIGKTSGEDVLNKANQSGQDGLHNYVKSDTKFENLTFRCAANSADNNFIECHGNDVWFGKGLVMTNFRNLSKGHGNLEVAQNIPELTIVLTATNLNEADLQKYIRTDLRTGNNRSKPQTLTIESGHYGRIMGGRFTNKFFSLGDNTSHTILGSTRYPLWAIVNIDIDKDNPNKGTIERGEEPNKGTVTDNFTLDINCIIAGLTDGSMYGDYTINVHGGKIAYIVGGNQGNPVPNGSKTFAQSEGGSGNWGQWPNATYLGRTIINIEQDPELKEINIDNLYAGGLGREANGANATSIVDMYMYGHTEINMKSGTVLGNVYGGGAGGVIGLNPWDKHVPYATTESENVNYAIMNGVQYGEWGAKKAGSPLANVTLHDSDGKDGYTTKLLNLGESYTTVNISGGTINGSVYGGGCGFVSNMPKEVVMQGVGSVFGTSNVNISGGTIHGSVYGGSEGSAKYYNATNKYNQTINHIAEMNGTVNMKITCDNILTPPTIDGNIYGAGMGIASNGTEEYLRIATAGNIELGGGDSDKYKTDINILIDLPEEHPFNGNIYGGGQMGAVDGNTKVVIKGGTFEKDIFGGGKGEDGHPNKAKVTGNTSVIVNKNWTEPIATP